jgi:hypothetical protein
VTWRAVLSEAWRNVCSGTTRALTAFAVLLAIVVSAGALDGASVRQITARVHDFRAHAADVFTVAAAGQINGSACSALTDGHAVRASGALRAASAATPTAAPYTPIPVYDVSAGLLRVLGVHVTHTSGVWASRAVATQYAVSPQRPLSTASELVPISGIIDYPEDGRNSVLAFSLLRLVADDEDFDQCWATVWPYAPDAVAALLAVIAGGPSAADVTTDQLNATLGREYDPRAAFATRPTRWAPLVCLPAAMLLGAFSVWRRRLELAAALHLGLRPRALLAVTLTEAAVVACFVAVASAGLLLAIAGGAAPPGEADWSVASVGWSSVPPAIAGFLLGVAAATMTVHERRYFDYFKDRSG